MVALKSQTASLISGHRRFADALEGAGHAGLRRERTVILQINVGKQCNQACKHCHVDAGPTRTESMSQEVAERLMALLADSPHVSTVDITGGAPELCGAFEYLVTESRKLGRHVIVRHNLTVQFEPGFHGLVDFFAAQGVEVVASLPCYTAGNVDAQRGNGVFMDSIEGLRALNAAGFGTGDPKRPLSLVYNPGGPFLPPCQTQLQADYTARLADDFGVSFDHLITITNQPINRWAGRLMKRGEYRAYMDLIEGAFNGATIPALMCRHQISVSYDGKVYDCDFNQVIDLPNGAAVVSGKGPETIWGLDHLGALDGDPIALGSHCFACTAGAGSSCGGSLA